MLGNVWEWVQDTPGDYPKDSGGQDAVEGDASSRVLRGASWYGSSNNARSSSRHAYAPYYTIDGIGFRVARTPL